MEETRQDKRMKLFAAVRRYEKFVLDIKTNYWTEIFQSFDENLDRVISKITFTTKGNPKEELTAFVVHTISGSTFYMVNETWGRSEPTTTQEKSLS